MTDFPISTQDSFDVLVLGGGPAGVAAAVAAGRLGVRTGLIERHPILGGMGTAALVNNFCCAHNDGKRHIIGGIFKEIRDQLLARKAIYQNRYLEPYDPAVYQEILQSLCKKAGVKVITGQTMESISRQGNHFNLRFKGGLALQAQSVVDASGDATTATHLGVHFNQGRPGDHKVMPLTYCYLIGPIDLAKAEAARPGITSLDPLTGERFVWGGGFKEQVAVARAAGELSIPRVDVAMITGIPGREGYAAVNYGRVFCQDPTDPAQLDAAEQEGLKQVREGVAFFRKYLPGFEKVEAVEIARQIGVRESRQIVGHYTLTSEDVLGCRQFDDVICQCWYPIDIHEPGSDTTTMKGLPEGEHYDIPLRCLIPASGPDGIIFAGRSISATHEAMSSFRVAPSAMGIGEAAGVAAALSFREHTPLKTLSAKKVQQRLLETGGILS